MHDDTLFYITSNVSKIEVAKKFLSKYGFNVEAKSADVEEIQSEDIEKIAIHKAQQAYEQLKHPLFVNDAGWYIPALNGFPGPFMKYVDEWFSPEDFLHLMKSKEDKTIMFKEINCYIDKNGYKTFQQSLKGHFVNEVRGPDTFSSLKRVISLSGNGMTIAEWWEEKKAPINEQTLWVEMAEWLKANKTQ